MSEANKILAETRRWLAYARQDLTADQALAGQAQSFSQQICFLSQQAAEKSLKAVLIFPQIEFPFRHDLELFRTLFPEDWQCSQLTNLEQLTEWAVEGRYPTERLFEKGCPRYSSPPGGSWNTEFCGDYPTL